MAAVSCTPKSLLVFATGTALAVVLPAQRDEVTLPGQKPGKVTVAYGVVNLGDHGLHELPVGNSWRMGHGDPSTLLTELPLLAGEELLVPGGYGVNIYRAGEHDLRLNVGGGGRGGGPGGGPGGGRGGGRAGRGGGLGAGIQFPGELSDLKKKAKKLQLTWLQSPPKKKSGGDPTDAGASKSEGLEGLKTCCLRVEFGAHRLDIPLTVVGATSHRIKGFTGLAFTYPLKLFKDRLPGSQTPVLSLIPRKVKRGEAPGFNVMVGEKAVLLVPMSKAPEGFGGFGGRGGGRGRGGRGGRGGDQPDARDKNSEPQEIEGTVAWEAAQEQCDHVLIKAVKVAKKELQFEIHLDDRIGKVKVGMP